VESLSSLSLTLLVFIVLIIYSQQISKYVLEATMKHHNRFCNAIKKELVCMRLKLTTLMLSAHMQYLSKKKRREVAL